jgi:N-methylhydantoinase B
VCVTFAAGVRVPMGRGLSGGHPGAATANVILRDANVRELFAQGRIPTSVEEIEAAAVEVQAPKVVAPLGDGDFLLGLQASGAGYGDPLAREPALVARDVADGLVSEQFASAVYGVVLAGGEVDETATARAREAVRRERVGGAPAADPPLQGVDGAVALHPVCDTVEAVERDGERRLRCTVCRQDLGAYDSNPKRAGVVHELALDAISPHNARCLPDYILREYCCPGCATVFAADVVHRDEPLQDEVALEAAP